MLMGDYHRSPFSIFCGKWNKIECFSFPNILHSGVESTLFILFVPKSKRHSAPLLAEVSSLPSLSLKIENRRCFIRQRPLFPSFFLLI